MQAPMVKTRAIDIGTKVAPENYLQSVSKLRQMKLFMKIDKYS
jgi:hypothetical protein